MSFKSSVESKLNNDAGTTAAKSSSSAGSFFTGSKTDVNNPTISNYYKAIQQTDPSSSSNERPSINPLSNTESAISNILEEQAASESKAGKPSPTVIPTSYGVSKPSYVSSSFTPSSPVPSSNSDKSTYLWNAVKTKGQKPVIVPTEGYGALSGNTKSSSSSSSSSGSSGIGSGGGWSAANSQSQEESIFERFNMGEGNNNNNNNGRFL
jgi:hypothetical protein